MSSETGPSISAVVAAYQAEDWIGETLESILAQTRPPEEVVVVDDGSTDGTARELERFAARIRVVRQPNRGCPAAFNTAFREARSDFAAMCGADDLWHPQKLEWQAEALDRHPQADVLFGHARLIGRIEADHARPPGAGLLDSGSFRDALYRECCVPASSVLIRHSLFARLGPFVEDFGADDWEYWFRCLRAGARFYYDPRELCSWRHHENNLTRQTDWMDECTAQVRTWYAADVTDRALANQHFRTARKLVEDGDHRAARRAFRRSLRLGLRDLASAANMRALVWVAILVMPKMVREWSGRTLTQASRTLDGLRGGRHPSLP